MDIEDNKEVQELSNEIEEILASNATDLLKEISFELDEILAETNKI